MAGRASGPGYATCCHQSQRNAPASWSAHTAHWHWHQQWRSHRRQHWLREAYGIHGHRRYGERRPAPAGAGTWWGDPYWGQHPVTRPVPCDCPRHGRDPGQRTPPACPGASYWSASAGELEHTEPYPQTRYCWSTLLIRASRVILLAVSSYYACGAGNRGPV